MERKNVTFGWSFKIAIIQRGFFFKFWKSRYCFVHLSDYYNTIKFISFFIGIFKNIFLIIVNENRKQIEKVFFLFGYEHFLMLDMQKWKERKTDAMELTVLNSPQCWILTYSFIFTQGLFCVVVKRWEG